MELERTEERNKKENKREKRGTYQLSSRSKKRKSNSSLYDRNSWSKKGKKEERKGSGKRDKQNTKI